MEVLEYGDRDAAVMLLQMVDDHDLETIENEVALIEEQTGTPFRLIACKVQDWNADLSPWAAPAVFGNQPFGGGAQETLKAVLALCEDRTKTYYIGGYSLAGLFALWAVYQTDRFQGAAAASPSMWFPGLIDYMKTAAIESRNVYLSLGKKEEKTRNKVMAAVGDRIREAEALLKTQGVHCVLEWNEGNHFRDADRRTARAFSWVMQQSRSFFVRNQTKLDEKHGDKIK